MILLAVAMSYAGLHLAASTLILLCVHVALLLLLLLAARNTAQGLRFTASKSVLTKHTEEHYNETELDTPAKS